jgi:hypothetical protein
MLSVIMLSVIMLSAIRLTVILLSVNYTELSLSVSFPWLSHLVIN